MLPHRIHPAVGSFSKPFLAGKQILNVSTLAQRNLSLADPTAATGFPANINKIASLSRTAQVARHLSLSSTFQQPKAAEMAGLPVSEKGFHGKAPSAYTVRTIGAANTLEHRIFIEKDGVPVSAFHDVPLYANEQQTIMNMVVEIPRWSNAKSEVRHDC